MEKVTVNFVYILSFRGIDIIGGEEQYKMEDKCYSILGIRYRDVMIDIKTKEVYPILQVDENGTIQNNTLLGNSFACLDENILTELGLNPAYEIDEQDCLLLEEEIKTTLLYREHLEKKTKEKIIPYQKFKRKRFSLND